MLLQTPSHPWSMIQPSKRQRGQGTPNEHSSSYIHTRTGWQSPLSQQRDGVDLTRWSERRGRVSDLLRPVVRTIMDSYEKVHTSGAIDELKQDFGMWKTEQTTTDGYLLPLHHDVGQGITFPFDSIDEQQEVERLADNKSLPLPFKSSASYVVLPSHRLQISDQARRGQSPFIHPRDHYRSMRTARATTTPNPTPTPPPSPVDSFFAGDEELDKEFGLHSDIASECEWSEAFAEDPLGSLMV